MVDNNEYNNDKKNFPYFELVIGINPVLLLLKRNAGRRKIFEIYIDEAKENDFRLKEILDIAEQKNIKVLVLTKKDFKKILKDDELKSQGVCARVSNYSYLDLDNYLKKDVKKNSRLIILDKITDIGNFGGIIRNCLAFNFDGIVIPKHDSVYVNKDVSRISAGALEATNIFRVSNLFETIKKLKSNNFWIYCSCLGNLNNLQQIDEIKFSFPLALILGSEHKGASRLLRENSDVLVYIKINNIIDSLNVSVASGIMLYEISKQASDNFM
jgi:23S rRNA (guanosine2251-2'-O)-methyltransferase